MSFHIIYESTTADATDVNDNFYHIAQGSRLPMDGVAMGYTDNSLDLGSSSVRWNNLICTNIDTASVSSSYAKMPIVIADYTLPQAANEFEIAGLNGDSSILYKMIIFLPAPTLTTMSLIIHPNTYTGALAQAIIMFLYATGATLLGYGGGAAGAGVGAALLSRINANTAGTALGELEMYSKTGNSRPGSYRKCNVAGSDGEHIGEFECGVLFWADSTTTITSFKFFSFTTTTDLVAGTRVILMGMDNA